MNAKKICASLGPMYSVRTIDAGEVIYRKLDDFLEVEAFGAFARGGMTVNLWRRAPRVELLAVYAGIHSEAELLDVVGHLSFRYRNLRERIRVEREAPL